MTVEELAALVIDACEAEGIEHMVTGAFATGFYGIPRSTKDVDVVLSLAGGSAIECMMARLDPHVAFDPQIQFDTLTWGRRQVGIARQPPPLKVELFELYRAQTGEEDSDPYPPHLPMTHAPFPNASPGKKIP